MHTIPRQYLYCEQTTSGSIVSALYRLDIRCIVYDTAPISILCANNIRPIYNLYCSIVSALYRLDIRYTVYTILGQYPYCVQTIITQYWANTCMYRKRIPIQYRANFTLFPGITAAKAIDVKNILDDFFTSNGLSWNMVSAVCTNGAPAIIGCKSGLKGLIKSVAPHIAFTHCMLHKHALVSKMLPSSLADVLKIVVKTVNFVRGRALNHRIFMQLCEKIDSKFKVLLYHTEV